MTKRFTAEDARTSVFIPALDYDSVIRDIKQECSDGRKRLLWYRGIDSGTLNLLEQDGFKVKIIRCQQAGDSTEITW